MKNNQKGYTVIEAIIVLALITSLLWVVFSTSFFQQDFNEEERETVETQFNYALIEYYGLFEYYPFAQSLKVGETDAMYVPDASQIVIAEDDLELICDELKLYTGYDIESIADANTLLNKYDIKLTYKNKHIAEVEVLRKP